jgi:hypothetical protein
MERDVEARDYFFFPVTDHSVSHSHNRSLLCTRTCTLFTANQPRDRTAEQLQQYYTLFTHKLRTSIVCFHVLLKDTAMA